MELSLVTLLKAPKRAEDLPVHQLYGRVQQPWPQSGPAMADGLGH